MNGQLRVAARVREIMADRSSWTGSAADLLPVWSEMAPRDQRSAAG